jgi:hypothetical protein
MLLGGLLLMTCNSGAGAATGVLESSIVTRILVDSESFGECMALVVPGPESLPLNCQVNWVSFSCSGDFNSRSVAQQKFSAAQLSYVTQTPMRIVIDDARRHNGYCFAVRADNI